MMKTPEHIMSITTTLIEQAMSLYRDLNTELLAAIERLKSDDCDLDEKTRAETLKAHRKAIQTVLDLEVQFLKQVKGGDDPDDGELTRTRKVRRRIIEDKYDDIIAALYDDSSSVDTVTEVTYEDGRKGTISASLEVRTAKVFPVAQKIAAQ